MNAYEALMSPAGPPESIGYNALPQMLQSRYNRDQRKALVNVDVRGETIITTVDSC